MSSSNAFIQAQLSTKSGGPNTAQGKQITSRNAIKTGAYSKTVILPGESPSDFEHLQHQLMIDFAPQDIAEQSLVRELSVLMWKQIRLTNLEHRSLFHELHEPPSAHEVRSTRFIKSEAALIIWPQLLRANEDDVRSHCGALQFARDLLLKERTTADLDKIEVQYPDLYQALERCSENYFTEPLTKKEMFGAIIDDDEGREIDFLPYAFQESISYLEKSEWIWKNLDGVKQEIAQLQDRRLLSVMRGPGLERAHSDLSRSFFRTLSELRKHQNWRYQKNSIDITPDAKQGIDVDADASADANADANADEIDESVALPVSL